VQRTIGGGLGTNNSLLGKRERVDELVFLGSLRSHLNRMMVSVVHRCLVVVVDGLSSSFSLYLV
jgi:hypothetical protein